LGGAASVAPFVLRKTTLSGAAIRARASEPFHSSTLLPFHSLTLRLHFAVRSTRWRIGASIIGRMVELTQMQMETVERLFAAGFRPIAIAPYESALIVHRGECAAVLAPVANGGLRLMAPATVLVDGNLSVRLKRASGDVFVWKKTEVPAAEERLKELEKFRSELEEILEVARKQ
jgi:hypothetical protein